MPFNVQCKKCLHYRNEWCAKKLDSPDPEMVRDCLYYSAATNADRIRAMTDEELDRFLSGVHNNIGSGRAQIAVWNNSDRPIRIWRTGWLDWLKQECEK